MPATDSATASSIRRSTTGARSIDTNITGTLYLIQKVLPAMVARNDGKVLVTGSVAGYIPGAFQAVYNGIKAFIDSFTEALRNEIKDADGVTLTTLMPGAGRHRVLRPRRHDRHRRSAPIRTRATPPTSPRTAGMR